MRAMITTNSSETPVAVSTSSIQTVSVTMDSKGRVRVSKEQRREILAKFEGSGVSAVEFARVTGLKYSTLAGWLQRSRRRPSRAGRMRLLEAVVEAGKGDKHPLVLELAGGVKVEIHDAAQAVLAGALLRALQAC